MSPEMRYRDRNALWRSDNPTLERLIGLVGSFFRAFSFSLSFFLSFTLCDTFTFSGPIVTCFLFWHFDVCILALLLVFRYTYTHTCILSVACFHCCIATNSCMGLGETSMHELDPVLKRSNPPIPRDGAAAAAIIAAALLRLLVKPSSR